ncbi:aminotransferase class I and II domain-containing protein [Phthorimaea operculella]|nr:aminotransferase class I and II domain-containing protein [Phthorimaea operculella]
MLSRTSLVYLDEDHQWGLDPNELERSLKEAQKNCNVRALVVINPGNPTGQRVYRMWSRTSLVYLDEDHQWGLDPNELERSLKEAQKNCNVRALVVINPGNPTGQVLTRQNIEDVIKFAHKHNLFIFADEVYQDNVYAKGSKFHSFKKVLREMGSPYTDSQELASFMSVSKGYMGECGLRGGWMELVNLDPQVQANLYKAISAMLCPTTLGQAAVDCVARPPMPGEPSYDIWVQEKASVLESLNMRAKMIVETFNSMEGFTCNTVQAAVDCVARPPMPGEPSYDLWAQEKTAVLESLNMRAKMIVETFNSMEGFTCNTVQAAVDCVARPPMPGEPSYDLWAQEKAAVLESLNMRAKMIVETFNSMEGFTCNTVQAAVDCVARPPMPGEPSYDLWAQEKTAVLESLNMRAKMIVETFNSMEGFTCNTVQAAVDCVARPPMPGEPSYDLWAQEKASVLESLNMRAKMIVETFNSMEGFTCNTVQAAVDCVARPPMPGEPSYDLWAQEKTAVLESLNMRAKMIVETFNSMEGFTCNTVQAAVDCVARPPMPGEPSYDLWAQEKASVLESLNVKAKMIVETFNSMEGFTCNTVQAAVDCVARPPMPGEPSYDLWAQEKTSVLESLNMRAKMIVETFNSMEGFTCNTVQAAVDCVARPPMPGEPSYDLWAKEKASVLESLNMRAKMIVETFNSMEGFTCNTVQGAMYAFPRIDLPPKAIEAAKQAGQAPDVFYAFRLLEETGEILLQGAM